MPTNTESSINPNDILRQMDALGGKVAEAIDQLLAQRRTILETAKAKASELDAQVQRLNELYKSANGRYYVPPPKTGADEEEEDGEFRRTRRGHAELEAYAKEIVAFVVSRSPNAVSGAEIRERFPDVKAGIREFVQKYAGVELRDNGAARAALRYLPPA